MNPKAQTLKDGNPLMYLFRATWRYSAGNHRKVLLFWALFSIAESIELFGEPLIFAKIISITQQEGVTTSSLPRLLALLAGLLVTTIAFWALHGPARLIERANAFGIRITYRRHLLSGVMHLPLAWHSHHHSGDTIDKVNKGSTALYEFAEDSFETIYSITRLIGSYCVLLYFSKAAGLIVLIIIAINVYVTLRFDRILMGHYHQLNHAENHINQSIFDSISNITAIITSRAERLILTRIVGTLEAPFDVFRASNRLNELKWCITSIWCTVMTVTVLGIYFWQHIGASEGVLLGSAYLLMQYLEKISQLFFRFTGMYAQVVWRKTKIMNAEELATDFVAKNVPSNGLPTQWQRLEIKNLDFCHNYEDGQLHLDNISLSIRRGEHIALIGPSGCGKSTLMKIMAGIMHPQRLQLSIDGHSIEQGFLEIANSSILIPQKPEIFEDTVMNNLTMGAVYDPDLVRKAIDIAQLTETINGLPEKYKTRMREKGTSISGGQEQRVAIARGLLQFLTAPHTSILLLDESTSNLDSPTAMQILQGIQQLGGTTVFVTHKLSDLGLFDKIYLLNKGQIVAEGTLPHLMRSSPEFRELWSEYHTHHHSFSAHL